MRIVGITGGLTMPSRTKALVEFVLKQSVTPLARATELIDVAELAPELGFTLARQDAGPALEAVLKKIEDADLLVVGTPIAKGSYTGLRTLGRTSDAHAARNRADREHRVPRGAEGSRLSVATFGIPVPS